MKLQNYREDFYTYSGKASDVSRQLAFAAIAIVWLFKQDKAGQLAIPRELFLPSILVVLALAADLLHYCLGAVTWYLFYRSKERKKVPETAEIQHSEWLERPISFLFWVKIILVIVAYWFILKFLLRAIGMI